MLSKHAFGYGTKLHQKLGLIAVLMMQTEFFCWTNETYQNKWNYNFLNLDIWMLDLTERKSQFSILTSGSAPWRTEVWEWSGKCWQHWCIVFKAAQNRMHCAVDVLTSDRHYMFFQINSLLRRLSFEQSNFKSLKASTTLIWFGKRSKIKLEAVLFQN